MNLKTAAAIAAMGAAVLLSGCAVIPDTVHSRYTPPARLSKVTGAEKVVVDVTVKNQKKHKYVSATEDMIGLSMAGVYVHGGVSNFIKQKIDTTLRDRGFIIGGGGQESVHVVVTKFFVHEHADMFKSVHDGNFDMNVNVISKNGAVEFSKSIAVKNDRFVMGKKNGMFSLGRTTAINGTANDAVNKLMNNQQFIDALMHSAGVQQGATVGPMG